MNILQEITTPDGTWSIEENNGAIEIHHGKSDADLSTMIPITVPVMELLALALRNRVAAEAEKPTDVVSLREFWREATNG